MKVCATPDFDIDLNGQDIVPAVNLQGEEGGVAVYRLTLSAKEPSVPRKITLTWRIPKRDMFFVWRANDKYNRNLLPDWWTVCASSRSASGTPVLAIFGKNDENRYTVALSDCKTPLNIRAGVREESAELVLKIELFSELSSPVKEYETLVRIDTRGIPVYESISDAGAWWSSCGYAAAHLPEAATLPVYSTWYSFHQNFTADDVIGQCKIAKDCGMESVFIDDGWQTDDNGRGYAYCGDWKVCEKKIPDMKKFVGEIHALGMKVVFWFSVPYVGIRSRAAERFKGKFLYYDEGQSTYVLDPRYREVREYLAQTYVEFAKEYQIDGFKLDFIDAFALREPSPEPNGEMDFVSLEDGVDRLLCDIMQALCKVNPEILIEFRQNYVGAVMQQYGNMFRVGDCPGDAVSNKIGTVDLRLLSRGLAVHADPAMWHDGESTEHAAYQINHGLFGVPQISVDLMKLPPAHIKMLSFYLNYQRENRQTLLFGKMRVHGLAHNYLSAAAESAEKRITALYGENIAEVTGGKNFDIVNATDGERVILDVKEPITLDLTVKSCTGETAKEYKALALETGLYEFSVPVSGFLFARMR